LIIKGDRERLVPFVLDQYVKRVDLEAKLIEVDWDPEF
jgi:16S rRNA processing protein RimM